MEPWSQDFHNKNVDGHAGRPLLFAVLSLEKEPVLSCPPAFKYMIFNKEKHYKRKEPLKMYVQDLNIRTKCTGKTFTYYFYCEITDEEGKGEWLIYVHNYFLRIDDV